MKGLREDTLRGVNGWTFSPFPLFFVIKTGVLVVVIFKGCFGQRVFIVKGCYCQGVGFVKRYCCQRVVIVKRLLRVVIFERLCQLLAISRLSLPQAVVTFECHCQLMSLSRHCQHQGTVISYLMNCHEKSRDATAKSYKRHFQELSLSKAVIPKDWHYVEPSIPRAVTCRDLSPAKGCHELLILREAAITTASH